MWFFSFDLVNSCSKIEKDDKSAGEESDISDDDTGKRRFPIGSAGKYWNGLTNQVQPACCEFSQLGIRILATYHINLTFYESQAVNY